MLSLSVDTLAPNAPVRVWIPAGQDGISAEEASKKVNYIVDLSGSNVVAGDEVIVEHTQQNGSRHSLRCVLTSSHISHGFVLFRPSSTELSYALDPNFKVYFKDQAGNASVYSSDVRLGVTGLPKAWLNDANGLSVSFLSRDVFEVMANTPGFMADLGAGFFNRLNLDLIWPIGGSGTQEILSDNFIRQIPVGCFSDWGLSSDVVGRLVMRINY